MKITISENSIVELPHKMSLQWSIYKGILARQSLGLDIYNDYVTQFETFCEIMSTDTDEYNIQNHLKIDQLIANLKNTINKLKSVLTAKNWNEINICLNKILDFLENMR